MVDDYTYRIEWVVGEEEFVGLCSEFPSLSWLAESPEAAGNGIANLVREVLEAMQARGEELPKPFTQPR